MPRDFYSGVHTDSDGVFCGLLCLCQPEFVFDGVPNQQERRRFMDIGKLSEIFYRIIDERVGNGAGLSEHFLYFFDFAGHVLGEFLRFLFPVQKDIPEKEQEFIKVRTQKGKNYAIKTMADYSITGLVVATNTNFFLRDVMRTQFDEVCLMDIGLVWGDIADKKYVKSTFDLNQQHP